MLLSHLRRTHFSEGDRGKAQAEARGIAAFLKQRYPVRVWGIGSAFARDRTFRQDSDIDLLVEGIPPGDFFAATAKAADLGSFPVDIVPLESAMPEFLDLIWQEAVEL